MDVPRELTQCLNELEFYFQKNKKEIRHKFVNSFKVIFQKIGVQDKISDIAFINITLLRTDILDNYFLYSVYVYDEDWYFGSELYIGDFDVSEIYQFYIKLKSLLNSLSKKYIGGVTLADVEKNWLNLTEYFHLYVVKLMRYAILEAVESEEYKTIKKAKQLEILTGEYYEPCNLIYVDGKNRLDDDLYRWLQEKDENAYCVQDFRSLNLSNTNYNTYNFLYSNFQNSDLRETDLCECNLIGARFNNAYMTGTNFKFSNISECDFTGASLIGADFSYSLAYTEKSAFSELILDNSNYPGQTEVIFRRCNLTNTNFYGAVIIGGDFTNSIVNNANFSNAVLYRSIFSRDQINQLKLTTEQLKQIKIKNE